MEYLPKNKLLKFNHNTLEEVRKSVDLHKPGAMKHAVEILKNWIKQQNHFTKKEFDTQYLETLIILSKGSVERTKEKLDRICTLRTLMPHLFGIYDIRGFYEKDLKDATMALLPKMTKSNDRVCVLKSVCEKFEPTTILNWTRVVSVMAEYVRRHDYAISYYAIADYTKTNLTEFAAALTLKSAQEAEALLLGDSGFRLKGLFIISDSKLIDIIVSIIKRVISKKMGDRVHVYHDFESLHNVFEKDILPVEFGGTEKSLKLLHEEWIETISSEDYNEYLKDIYSARTDENLRQKGEFNKQYLGMPGTFRTLNLD